MLMTLRWFPSTRRFQAVSRTDSKTQLTDSQWLRIAELFPQPRMTRSGGRPAIPPRACLEGILWILRTGSRWKDLPDDFPSYPTCWRRFQQWTQAGIFQQAWTLLLETLDQTRRIQWEECMADGTFVPAKKGGTVWERPSVAKEP